MITIIAFNYEYAGSVVNGPGICLKNFEKILRDRGVDVNIFTVLPSKASHIRSIKDLGGIKKSIKNSDVLQIWSGLNKEVRDILRLPISRERLRVIGPNVLDGVMLGEEVEFLKDLNFSKILTINEKLRCEISALHNIPLSKIGIFQVGPDLDLWAPSNKCDGTILWKGNSKQFVKDVKFGLKLQDALPQYNFKFIGYPNRYVYSSHIKSAKESRMQIVTSLSETMGMAMMEGWASGVPSVSHPKIYMMGDNYKTGIISSKTIKDYSDAVKQIMESSFLYENMRAGARQFMEDNFSSSKTFDSYMKMINNES